MKIKAAAFTASRLRWVVRKELGHFSPVARPQTYLGSLWEALIMEMDPCRGRICFSEAQTCTEKQNG